MKMRAVGAVSLVLTMSGVASLVGCSSDSPSNPDGGADANTESGNPDSGNPDSGNPEGGGPDSGIADAGDADGSSVACTDPTSGTTTRFAANAVTLPVQKSDFAFDLDGDGKLDNQFGAFLGALSSQGMDSQASETAAIVAGRAVLLVQETSDDPTGQSDPCAGARLSAASPTSSAPKFDGTDTFTADTATTSGQLRGAITAGQLVSENPATATTPVSATLRLAPFGATSTMDLPLVGAEVELTRSGATISAGRIHGAIRQSDVQQVVVPALAAAFNAQIAANPTATSSQQLLSLFDNGGVASSACGSTCKNLDGTCATANDGTISDCEVGTNSLIANLLAPDVQLFDSQNNWHPTPGGTTKDSLSVGLGFTGVAASF